MSRSPTQQRGAWAEQLSAQHLQAHGLQILEKNYRSRYGEIDLIARDGDCTVFVEVRYRANTRFGQPYETVDRRKQQRLIKTAMSYLQQHKQAANKPCRFDIISVTKESDSINWIQHAFDLESITA